VRYRSTTRGHLSSPLRVASRLFVPLSSLPIPPHPPPSAAPWGAVHLEGHLRGSMCLQGRETCFHLWSVSSIPRASMGLEEARLRSYADTYQLSLSWSSTLLVLLLLLAL